MNETGAIDFQISYAEDVVTVAVKVDSSPNQDKTHRISTLQEALESQNIRHDNRDEGVRVYLDGEEEVEKALECFRIF